ncbi:MAG: ribosomal L7Ae/L30e/S12e/Gadd45 family protein [Gemmatimonadetes bacterium]|nr:ribosomal L7Ae/L30e/S12e/Gadd45 family protein [Gemmatimonadota bacterium]
MPDSQDVAAGALTAAQWKKVSALLGLGVRARTAVVGVELVRGAAQKGTVALAVVADDASVNSLDKVVPMLRAKRIAMVNGVTAQQLGAAVGRETTAVVAVVDEALARGIRGALASSAS